MNNEKNYEMRRQIGKRISELREQRGLSQRQLAEAAGLNQQNLSRIELGKYSTGIDILVNIAEALNCEINFIEKL